MGSNAGIGIGVPSITEMSLEDWRRETAIILDGVFRWMKDCMPSMTIMRRILVQVIWIPQGHMRFLKSWPGYGDSKGKLSACAGRSRGMRIRWPRHPGRSGDPSESRHPVETSYLRKNASRG